jgi:CRP/FNR family transcriptional regulator, cyclic AMP receptor protein
MGTAARPLARIVWQPAVRVNAALGRWAASALKRGSMAQTTGWVPLLQVDHELAERLSPATLAAAEPMALAPTEWLDPGEWHPRSPADEDRSTHLGLLVLDGFLARRVRVLERPATELLGPGDLLLPWEPDRTEPFAVGARWEVLEEARVAVLDRRFTGLVARWPEITVALFGRAVSRSRSLSLSLAITQLVGVDLRILAMLWHVAERWGVREADGIALPVRFTHELLGSLISAQRPTVTRALGHLLDDGRVSRRDDGLLAVHGEPPAQLRPLRSALS